MGVKRNLVPLDNILIRWILDDIPQFDEEEWDLFIISRSNVHLLLFVQHSYHSFLFRSYVGHILQKHHETHYQVEAT